MAVARATPEEYFSTRQRVQTQEPVIVLQEPTPTPTFVIDTNVIVLGIVAIVGLIGLLAVLGTKK